MSRHLRADEIVFKHDFFRVEKFVDAGIAATGLFVCAVAHSHRDQRDGLIPLPLLTELGSLNGVGISDGALTGMYVPASHDALAKRLVQSGLLHEVPGGYQIHDYADYQETTLSRRVRRVRDAQRKRKRDPESVGADSTRNPAGGGDLSTRASVGSALKAVVIPSSGFTAPADGTDDYPHGLETADYGSRLEPFRRVAADLRGADVKTPLALASVMKGLPESVLAQAIERLEARRKNTARGPVLNEAKWLVVTIKEIGEKHRQGAAA